MPHRHPHDIARDVGNASRDFSDRVKQSAYDAVDTTRDLASDTIDHAHDRLRKLRGRVDPAIDDITAGAQRLARRGIDLASDTGARAQQSLNRCAAVTERYVADQPVKAVLIAAVAGAVIAALVLSARKRRERSRN